MKNFNTGDFVFVNGEKDRTYRVVGFSIWDGKMQRVVVEGKPGSFADEVWPIDSIEVVHCEDYYRLSKEFDVGDQITGWDGEEYRTGVISAVDRNDLGLTYGIDDEETSEFHWLHTESVFASGNQLEFKIGDRISGKSLGGNDSVGRVIEIDRGETEFAYLIEGGRWIRTKTAVLVPETNEYSIVCRVDGGELKPSTCPHLHSTRESANKEAERLALTNPGKKFVVLTQTYSAEAEAVLKAA